MRKILFICLSMSLSSLAGCGSEAVTQIPDSISAEEIEQLEADAKRVEDEERQHLQRQRQQRRAR